MDHPDPQWAASTALVARSRPHILIAEDNAALGLLLAEMLVSLGYDVCGIVRTEADTVVSALRHRPDLMIVDVRLAEGSGVSAVEIILRTIAVRYVFMTGGTRRSVPAHAKLLQKPFRERELVRVLASMFDVPLHAAALPAYPLPG